MVASGLGLSPAAASVDSAKHGPGKGDLVAALAELLEKACSLPSSNALQSWTSEKRLPPEGEVSQVFIPSAFSPRQQKSKNHGPPPKKSLEGMPGRSFLFSQMANVTQYATNSLSSLLWDIFFVLNRGPPSRFSTYFPAVCFTALLFFLYFLAFFLSMLKVLIWPLFSVRGGWGWGGDSESALRALPVLSVIRLCLAGCLRPSRL